jgi:hypothetical protein
LKILKTVFRRCRGKKKANLRPGKRLLSFSNFKLTDT